MVEMINSLTGTSMLVEDSRKEEYLALGHKLVEAQPPAEPAPGQLPEDQPGTEKAAGTEQKPEPKKRTPAQK